MLRHGAHGVQYAVHDAFPDGHAEGSARRRQEVQAFIRFGVENIDAAASSRQIDLIVGAVDSRGFAERHVGPGLRVFPCGDALQQLRAAGREVENVEAVIRGPYVVGDIEPVAVDIDVARGIVALCDPGRRVVEPQTQRLARVASVVGRQKILSAGKPAVQFVQFGVFDDMPAAVVASRGAEVGQPVVAPLVVVVAAAVHETPRVDGEFLGEALPEIDRLAHLPPTVFAAALADDGVAAVAIAHAVAEFVEERHVVAHVVGVVPQEADILQPQRTATSQSALNVERSPREARAGQGLREQRLGAQRIECVVDETAVVDPQRILIFLCREQVGHVQRHGHGLAAMRGVHGEPVGMVGVFEVGETDAPRRLDGGEFLVIGILALDTQREVVGAQMRVFQDEDRLSRGGRILLVRRDEGYGRPELQERRHDVEPRQQELVRVPLYRGPDLQIPDAPRRVGP